MREGEVLEQSERQVAHRWNDVKLTLLSKELGLQVENDRTKKHARLGT